MIMAYGHMDVLSIADGVMEISVNEKSKGSYETKYFRGTTVDSCIGHYGLWKQYRANRKQWD